MDHIQVLAGIALTTGMTPSAHSGLAAHRADLRRTRRGPWLFPALWRPAARADVTAFVPRTSRVA